MDSVVSSVVWGSNLAKQIVYKLTNSSVGAGSEIEGYTAVTLEPTSHNLSTDSHTTISFIHFIM